MVYGTSPQIAKANNDDYGDTESGALTATSFNGAEQKTKKTLRNTKPPGYMSEVMFVMANCFMLKFYSERFYDAMTFFLLSIPLLAYLVCTLVFNVLEFIKILHIEELSGSLSEEEASQLISPKQQKLLTRVFRDLGFYFGVYYLSSQLDNIFQLKEDAIEKVQADPQFIAAIVFLEMSLLIQVCIMRYKRKEIIKA